MSDEMRNGRPDPDEGVDYSKPEPHPLLPGWITDRMMNDVWLFGLLLKDGSIMTISGIVAVYQAADGQVWIDVDMAEPNADHRDSLKQITGRRLFEAPTSRLRASVNTRNIIAAFETADT